MPNLASPALEPPTNSRYFQTFRIANKSNGAVLQAGFSGALLPRFSHDETEAAEFCSERMADEVLALISEARHARYAQMHMPVVGAWEVVPTNWTDGTTAWNAWRRVQLTGSEYAILTATSLPDWMRNTR